MHMLRKKDLSSDEMVTLRRSRTPTVVVTANGEVRTNEQAQVYVHDLGIFVTVQLLEDTPAVLSLGNLCEEHEYSCEWVSGQPPRLTKKEKNFLYAKRKILVPLDNSRSQGPKRLLRISKQSSICSRGAGLGHSVDPGVSVQNQNFTKKPREACKSSWSPRGNQKSFTLTIP